MSLMRLLTVGRSLGTIQDRPSPYKMTQQNFLPKFGPMNRAEAKADAVPEETRKATPKVERPKQQLSSWEKLLKTKKKMSSEALDKVGPDEQATAVVNVPKAAFPLGRWSMIKNPFDLWKTDKTQSSPTQGELSLDLVKPIRNDLNDADLEVVPVKKGPATSEKKLAAPAEKQEPVGYLWSRLSSRLFRTEQP